MGQVLELPIGEFLSGRTDYRRYADTCYDVYSYFHILHPQLGLLVSVPPLSPEIFTTVVSLFPLTNFPTLEPTTVYIEDYNFFELNALEFFQAHGLPVHPAPDRIILGLPYADYSNPLMWSALVHEMGHAFEKEKRVADRALPSLPPTDLAVLKSWAKELASDQLALRLLGSAYFNSLLGLILTTHPAQWTPSPSHPQPHTRFRLMLTALVDRGVLSASAKGYKEVFDDLVSGYSVSEITTAHTETFKCAECASSVTVTVPAPAVPLEDLWQRIRTVLEAEVQFLALAEFSSSASAVTPRLVELLRDGQPISAYREAADDEVLESLEAKGERTPSEMYAVLEKLEEKPATISQIVNAGWDRRWQVAEEVFPEIFRRSGPMEERFEAFREYTARFDRLLLKSVESATLHTALKG